MASGLKGFLGVLIFGLSVTATAGAQPLPTAAPQPKAAVPGSPNSDKSVPPPPAAQSSPGNSAAATIGKIFGFNKPGETTAFDANQRALVDRVSTYLSGIRTLVGDFVQVGPDGNKTQGQIYLQKPGRVRFEYDDPSPIELISDGSSVVVRDRKLATQDLYPLSQTPLRFLLADRVDLLKETNVVGVFADDVFATVVIEEKAIGGVHKLMLMFGAKDLVLRQWTITDPQGYDTTVAVYNLDTTKRPDPNLFKINYEKFPN